VPVRRLLQEKQSLSYIHIVEEEVSFPLSYAHLIKKRKPKLRSFGNEPDILGLLVSSLRNKDQDNERTVNYF